MSSQRYAPPSEGRIPQRERSPQRPPYNGRSSTTGAATTDSGNGYGPAPRGPKAFEGHRVNSAPSPSRGRGYSTKGDYRPDYRDRDSYRSNAEAPPSGDLWREWDRRDDGDFRSPRDAAPRDFEFGRGRRGLRDAPQPRFGDSRGPPAFSPRDEFARGRGRGDWAPRGRGRGTYYDDRPGLRGRSRSPRGYKQPWDRESFRDDRPDDRYEGPRSDRRESDALDREERAREAQRYRRELAINTNTNRGSNASPGPGSPTISNTGQPQSATVRRPSSSGRDFLPPRRHSSSFDPGSRPSVRSELPQNKDQTNSTGESRPSSPRPAPEVPAFGSISLKPGGHNDAPWNVWKAPADQKSSAAPLPAQVSRAQPPSSRISASSRSEIDLVAPKAPKAERDDSLKSIDQGPDELRARISDAVNATSPTLSGSQAPPMRPFETNTLTRAPPSGPRQVPGAPSAPKALAKQDSAQASWPAPSGPGQHLALSPKAAAPASAPSAPRALTASSASKFSNVPTGPRSARPQPPTNPRIPTGPASDRLWQRTKLDTHPSAARQAGALVPSKREHDGTERAPWSPGAPAAETTKNVSAIEKQGSQHADTLDRNSMETHIKDKARHGISKPEDDADKATGYSDDEYEVEMNELDSAQNEEKFERDKARLESRKADLSADHLTGRLVLRQLSLLSCLAISDPAVFFEPRQPRARPVVETSAEKDIQTQEESAMVETLRKPSPKLTPSPIATPEMKSLPFLTHVPLTPMSELDAAQDNLRRQDSAKDLIISDIKRRTDAALDEEDSLRAEYERSYRSWRSYTKALDRQREETELKQREMAEERAEPQAVELSPTVTAATEPRRRGFTTDYELQKVIEMSKAEAEQEAQARKEKELVSSRPDYDREAVVPELAPELDLRSPEAQDMSRLEHPANAIVFWEFEPPLDTFDAEEHQTMLQNFREYPKKFGKIAQGLPNRTYKDCINHYYATKWNSQYKFPRDKKRSQRNTTKRTRAGANARPRANQLISNLDDAKPELYDGEEANAPLMAVTESGRPRRAAAPNFRDKGQPEQSIEAAKRAKADGSAAEKARRGGKTGAQSRRRPKGQSGARNPSMSPEKQSVENGQHEVRLGSSNGDVEAMHNHSASSANLVYGKGEPPPIGSEHPVGSMGAIQMEPKHQSARGVNAGPSSYWSVHEVTSFPGLLKHYGTDWGAIANAMGTKSHTMVKNYFGRIRGKDAEIARIAEDADARRERGEELGAPPSSGSTSRRPRSEQQLPNAARALAPNPDVVVDVEDGTPPATAHGISAHQTQHPTYRTPASAAHLDQVIARPNSFGQHPLADTSPPVPAARTVFPAASESHGSYSSDRRDVVQGRPMDQRSVVSAGAVDPLRYHTSNPDPWDRSSRAGDTFQAAAYSQPASGISRPSSPPRYDERSLFGPPSSRVHAIDRERIAPEDLSRVSRRADSPQPPPAGLRFGLDSTNARPSSTPFYDATRSSTSMLGREATMQQHMRSHESEPARQPPPPTSSGPRKSNLMSLLNAEEPAAPSNVPAPSPAAAGHSRVNTPTQFSSVSHSRYPSSAYPPPRPLSQPNRPEPISDHRRQPSSSQFHSVEAADAASRRVYRPEWPTSTLHGGERPVDSPPAYDPRSAVRSYSARFNPSPPPREGPSEPPRSYDQRLHQAHYGQPYRASSPPVRGYSYAPPAGSAHSRDSSMSRMPAGHSSLSAHRDSQYPEHRYSSSQGRLSERVPTHASSVPLPPQSSVYAPQTQSSSSAAYSTSRTPAPGSIQRGVDERHSSEWNRSEGATTDWMQGISPYRDRAERVKDPERYERAPPPPADDRERYSQVRYGPVGGQPPSAYPPGPEQR